MRVEVLISCMLQTDIPLLIKRTNIQSDVLVVNQCNESRKESFEFQNNNGENCIARIIHTTERGLSRSRNMAISNATGDICLICDDDEILENDYVETISYAFKTNPSYNIIAFRLNIPTKQMPLHSYKIGFLKVGGISSVQISFKREDIPSQISFCEKMGSGTGNGGGEENKFLLDCFKAGLKMIYIPDLIGSITQTESQWFHGRDKKYWINRGWIAKMMYGRFLGLAYIWYTCIFRAHQYDKENHWYNHIIWLHKGLFENR